MKMKKNTVRLWWYFGVFAFIFASFLFCLYTSTAHAGIRFIRNWEGYVYELEDPSSRTVTILQYKGEKKEITIPKEIKGKKVIMASLGKNNQVKKVHIPNGIIINASGLSKSQWLKTVTLEKDNPDYVVKNGLLLTKDQKMLVSCPGGLEYPKIPDSVTTIWNHAFSGSKIKKITLGKNISVLDQSAFENCRELQTIHFHKEIGMKFIGYRTFADCTSLTSIILPDSVEYVEYEAFNGCSSLETLVTSKNLHTFEGCIQKCPSLREVYILNKDCFAGYVWSSVVSGYEEVFFIDEESECKEQVTVYAPKDSKILAQAQENGVKCGVPEETDHGFVKNQNNFSYHLLGTGTTATISILGYTGTEKNITIPVRIEGIPVTSLESLGASSYIETVTIPDGIKIKGSAFSSCKNLKTIRLSGSNPDYVIKNKLLLSKDGRTLVACPGNVKYPKIPSGVTKIADGAFLGSSVKTVTLGKDISSLGYEVFKNCGNLTSVRFEKESLIKILHHRTFENCSSLKKLELPESIREIRDYVFSGCRKLTTLKTGKKLNYMGSYNFKNCKKLRYLYFTSKNISFAGTGESSLSDIAGEERNWRVTIYGKKNSSIQKELDKYYPGIVKFRLLEEGK